VAVIDLWIKYMLIWDKGQALMSAGFAVSVLTSSMNPN
jgi:hypothetical protein